MSAIACTFRVVVTLFRDSRSIPFTHGRREPQTKHYAMPYQGCHEGWQSALEPGTAVDSEKFKDVCVLACIHGTAASRHRRIKTSAYQRVDVHATYTIDSAARELFNKAVSLTMAYLPHDLISNG